MTVEAGPIGNLDGVRYSVVPTIPLLLVPLTSIFLYHLAGSLCFRRDSNASLVVAASQAFASITQLKFAQTSTKIDPLLQSLLPSCRFCNKTFYSLIVLSLSIKAFTQMRGICLLATCS